MPKYLVKTPLRGLGKDVRAVTEPETVIELEARDAASLLDAGAIEAVPETEARAKQARG